MIYLIKSYEIDGFSMKSYCFHMNKISGNIGNGQIGTCLTMIWISGRLDLKLNLFSNLILNEDNYSINKFESKISQKSANPDLLSRLKWS